MNSRHHQIHRGRPFILMTLFLAIMLFSGMAAASANGVNREIDTLAADQTIHGPGFFTGNLVRVDGTVEGTTFVSGQEVRINGTINGDLFAAAQTVTIGGKINGNIYTAGQNLVLETQTDGDVFAAGQTIKLPAHAVIGRDLMAAGQNIALEGTVKRHFNGGAEEMVLGGTVGQDAFLEVNDLQLLPGAMIGGNLTYKSEQQAAISPGATVDGQIDWEQVDRQPPIQPQRDPYKMLWRILLRIAGALLVWFIIRIWWPDLWTNVSQSLIDHPLKTLGVGVLVLLVTPLLIILLMVTVIGIPLGLILGILYGMTLYLSKIIVAVFLAKWAMQRFGWKEHHMGVWLVLPGLTILVLLPLIPYAGMLIRLLIILAGLGALFLSKYKGAKETVQ